MGGEGSGVKPKFDDMFHITDRIEVNEFYYKNLDAMRLAGRLNIWLNEARELLLPGNEDKLQEAKDKHLKGLKLKRKW